MGYITPLAPPCRTVPPEQRLRIDRKRSLKPTLTGELALKTDEYQEEAF